MPFAVTSSQCLPSHWLYPEFLLIFKHWQSAERKIDSHEGRGRASPCLQNAWAGGLFQTGLELKALPPLEVMKGKW